MRSLGLGGGSAVFPLYHKSPTLGQHAIQPRLLSATCTHQPVGCPWATNSVDKNPMIANGFGHVCQIVRSMTDGAEGQRNRTKRRRAARVHTVAFSLLSRHIRWFFWPSYGQSGPSRYVRPQQSDSKHTSGGQPTTLDGIGGEGSVFMYRYVQGCCPAW